MTEQENIKPCPFCGIIFPKYREEGTGTGKGRWRWVECGGCGARGPISIHNEHVEKWNTRNEAQEQPE